MPQVAPRRVSQWGWRDQQQSGRRVDAVRGYSSVVGMWWRCQAVVGLGVGFREAVAGPGGGFGGHRTDDLDVQFTSPPRFAMPLSAISSVSAHVPDLRGQLRTGEALQLQLQFVCVCAKMQSGARHCVLCITLAVSSLALDRCIAVMCGHVAILQQTARSHRQLCIAATHCSSYRQSPRVAISVPWPPQIPSDDRSSFSIPQESAPNHLGRRYSA